MDYFHLAQDAQALHKMSNLGLAYLGATCMRSWSGRGCVCTGS